MSTYLGNTPIAGITEKIKYNAHNLLDFKWSDHEINDMSWLRADTFSWQNAATYIEVYNLLSSSIQGATTATEQGVTFYICSNGLRIALADQETNVSTAYTNDGIAWYYILDTTNNRFKLPRTKFGFTGMRDSVGKFVEAGLPNITGTLGVRLRPTDNYNGALYEINEGSYAESSGGDRNGKTIGFDASRSSSIYGKSTTVQPPATQMYLYFYVGEYTQTAIEQTAGINTELFNRKADLSLPSIQAPYLKIPYVNGTSGCNIWSNGYCEQWGRATNSQNGTVINFIKTMADTNYIVILSPTGLESAGSNRFNHLVTDMTTTSFRGCIWGSDNHASNIQWLVKGYLEEGQY